MVFVLINKEEDKAAIKKYLDKVGVVSQFLLKRTTFKILKDFSVAGNVLKQVNAKLSGVNWQLNLPPQITNQNTMFIGMDVV